MIAALVLAAGEASRFGSPKQELLLPRVLDRIRDSSVSDIVVVLGAYEMEVTGARSVRCSGWQNGPGASLRCGAAALGPDVEAAVVCLADGPQLSSAAIDRVVAAWRGGAGDFVAASYDGVRSHPVVVARALWPEIPDDGGRALEPVLVPCDDLGAPGDVDTPQDLENLERLERRP